MKFVGAPRRNHVSQLFLLLHIIFFPAMCSVEVENSTRQEILRHLLYGARENSSKYDHRVPPNFDDDIPTNVTVQIFVLSFDSVTEAAMVNEPTSSASYFRSPTPLSYDHTAEHNNIYNSGHGIDRRNHPYTESRRRSLSGRRRNGLEFSVTIFLRQTWIDPRLVWYHPLIKDHLEVDAKMMEDIWTPDLYFVNEKEADMHEVTVCNKLLHLTPNGAIRHSIRISMTLSCDMFLDRYPHDEQKCSISLGSYSYSSGNVVFVWHRDPILLRPGMTLPQFQVSFDNTSDCSYFTLDGNMVFGNFSCIQADFKLSREFGYYMAQVYLPSVLIIILSWVSFWIDIDATPARVSLGLLTVLTMTTHSTGEKAALPRVSYVKAIDVWFSTCLFFVFAALLEFAYVNVHSRVAKRRTNTIVMADQNNEDQLTNRSRKDAIDVERTRKARLSLRFFKGKGNIERARLTDKISRVAFPAAFVIFNIAYWVYYR